MSTVCPYCNIEVSESSIEAEDGCCPECGSVISVTSSFMGEMDEGNEYDYDSQDDFLDEFDEDEDFEHDDFDGDFKDEDLDDEEFDDDEFADDLDDDSF